MKKITHNKALIGNKLLLQDLRSLILQARETVARSVNSSLVMLYWQMGRRINEEVLNNARGSYGEQILVTLSQELTKEFGAGYTKSNLSRMTTFADLFGDFKIVATLSQQLSWSHFVTILPLENQLQRDFYTEMCRIENWSVRTLRAKIGSLLYERTALSRKPEKLIKIELKKLRKEDRLTPEMVFRDPYLLDFLDLRDSFSEKNFEDAILRDLEKFILELGQGFTFIARQKRITVGGDDFYLDLLFYHRILKRLVAIELKLEKFKPEHKGQMELYLKWLARHEKAEGENLPLGIILCARKSDSTVELLEVDKSGIHVGSYQTKLLPQARLKKHLLKSIELARQIKSS